MKGTRKLALACVAGLLAIPGTSGAFPWNKDMRDQPSVKAQETEVAAIQSSMPVGGNERFPAPKDIIDLVRARLDAGRKLVNPIARSSESVDRGRVSYDTHCLVCHGSQGRGDGPVGKKFVPQPMELNLDYVQLQPDGQIFYTISHGSIAMPHYRQAMTVEDRWHLVNFIKEEFGEAESQ